MKTNEAPAVPENLQGPARQAAGLLTTYRLSPGTAARAALQRGLLDRLHPRAKEGALEGTVTPTPGKPAAGSVSALIERYYRSAEWKSLAPATKESFRRVYERFRQEHGNKPVDLLTTLHVNRMLDKMADRPGAAANFRKRLSALMNFAVSDGWIKSSPVTTAKRIRHVAKGIRTWSEEDIAKYRKHWPVRVRPKGSQWRSCCTPGCGDLTL